MGPAQERVVPAPAGFRCRLLVDVRCGFDIQEAEGGPGRGGGRGVFRLYILQQYEECGCLFFFAGF